MNETQPPPLLPFQDASRDSRDFFVPVSQHNYPELTTELLPDGVYYVQEYTTRTRDLRELAQKKYSSVPLPDLLAHQHLIRYPGTQVMFVSNDMIDSLKTQYGITDSITGLSEEDETLETQEQQIQHNLQLRQETKRMKQFRSAIKTLVKDQFDRTTQQIDTRFWTYSTKVDANINILIAARLINEKDIDLDEIALATSLPNRIDYPALFDAGAEIIHNRNVRTTLKAPGMILEGITDDDIYSSMSELLTVCALKGVSHYTTYNKGLLWPYYLESTGYSSQVPPLEFVPYIFETHTRFLQQLPDAIPPGKSLNFGIVQNRIMELLGGAHNDVAVVTIPDKIVMYYLKKDLINRNVRYGDFDSLESLYGRSSEDMQAKIQQMMPKILERAKELKQVYTSLKQHPELLKPPKPGDSVLPSYDAIRQEILDAGGKSPRSAKIRFRYRVSDGDV